MNLPTDYERMVQVVAVTELALILMLLYFVTTNLRK